MGIATKMTTKAKFLWALQIVIGLYFVAVAGANFIGIPPMIEQFDKIGVGQWFRYVTATCQLLGGIALLMPKFSFYGAVLLSCIMIGAIIVRMAILGSNPVFAIALLLTNLLIAWNRRNKA